MSKEVKEVKKVSKGRRIVKRIFLTIGIIILVLLLVIGILFGPFIYRYLMTQFNTKVNPVEVSLTTEQRLKDLDYMYDIVCLQNPMKEQMEEAYGISYEDVYNRYREYVTEVNTDYEFFSYLTCFLAVLPGVHNAMKLPDYDSAVMGGFTLFDQFGKQEIRDYAYAWKDEFRDDVLSYNAYNAIAFTYTNGEYIGMGPSNAGARKNILDYRRAKLLTIDGKSPEEMCFELLDRLTPRYDEGRDCYFRGDLIFNDSVGEKHVAKIEMPDGTIKTIDVYDDPAFDISFYDGISYYPDAYDISGTGSGSDSQEEVITDIWDDRYVPKTYSVYTDPDRHLVYVISNSCDTTEGPRLVRDMQQAIDSVGADKVILDIRSNGGGNFSFAVDQVLPALFSHDVSFVTREIGCKNDYTANYYNCPAYQLSQYIAAKKLIETDDRYFYNTEDFSVKGEAKGDYKIYLLTSHSTFSTGDILAVLCKEYDNATVIGANTSGEGICGSPFNCYLPESKFMFLYVPTVNITYPEDGYNGTSPDIYMTNTLEDSIAASDLNDQGLDVKSYEVRTSWDSVLRRVLEMIDSGEG